MEALTSHTPRFRFRELQEVLPLVLTLLKSYQPQRPTLSHHDWEGPVAPPFVTVLALRLPGHVIPIVDEGQESQASRQIATSKLH
jgi:hypothetical protein